MRFLLSLLLMAQTCLGITYINTNSVGGDSGQTGGAKINANFYELWTKDVALSNLISQARSSMTNLDAATSNSLHVKMLNASNVLALRLINYSNYLAAGFKAGDLSVSNALVQIVTDATNDLFESSTGTSTNTANAYTDGYRAPFSILQFSEPQFAYDDINYGAGIITNIGSMYYWTNLVSFIQFSLLTNYNVKAVVCPGNLTQSWTNYNQWKYMSNDLQRFITAGFPVYLSLGDGTHDYEVGVQATNFINYFSNMLYAQSSCSKSDWSAFGNSVYLQTNSGVPMMFMAVDGSWNTTVGNWASNMLSKYSNHYVTILQHSLLNDENEISQPGDTYYNAMGPDLSWNVYRQFPNVRQIICGHNYGMSSQRRTLLGNAGNEVQVIMFNCQNQATWGLDCVRIYTVYPDQNRIEARTIAASPNWGTNWLATNDFTVSFPMRSFRALSAIDLDNSSSSNWGHRYTRETEINFNRYTNVTAIRSFLDVWSIGRYTTNANLEFLYGTNHNHSSHPVAAQITPSGDLKVNGSISAIGGLTTQAKSSFSTNFTCSTNIHLYCCNGTNQLITLPSCLTSAPWQVYRFSSTNQYGSFVITNATGDQSIRDGFSLSFKQVGIGSPSFFHDGNAWWPAARTRIVMPSASWSTSTNIPLVNTVASNVFTYDTQEFNNSQGIALVGGSDIWVTNSGTYMLTYSAMVNPGHNGDWISIWLENGGTNVSRTRTDMTFSSTTVTNVMTVNYFVNVVSPTFFTLAGRAKDTGCALTAAAATTATNAPAAPSIIVTINRISDPYP